MPLGCGVITAAVFDRGGFTRLFPIDRLNYVEFSRINRWFPVLVYSHPGLYQKLGDFHSSRDLTSRIHLAGSYNSSGNVNTATTAGERAARELLVALQRRKF